MYRVSYTAGYTDAATGKSLNTSYIAPYNSSDVTLNKVIPKQAVYNLGYDAYQNSIQVKESVFDWYTKMGNTTISESGRNVALDNQNNLYFIGTYQSSANAVNNSGTTLTSVYNKYCNWCLYYKTIICRCLTWGMAFSYWK
jgi:hypothetical protein